MSKGWILENLRGPHVAKIREFLNKLLSMKINNAIHDLYNPVDEYGVSVNSGFDKDMFLDFF